MPVIPSKARNLRFRPLGRNKDFSVAPLLRNDNFLLTFTMVLKSPIAQFSFYIHFYKGTFNIEVQHLGKQKGKCYPKCLWKTNTNISP